MTRSLFRGRESNSDSWGVRARARARVVRYRWLRVDTTRVLAAPAEQHYGRVTLATRKTEWRVHPDILDARANHLGEEARSRETRASQARSSSSHRRGAVCRSSSLPSLLRVTKY